VLSLRSLKDKRLFLLLLFSTSHLFSAPREAEQQVQRMLTSVNEINYQLNHHKVEIDLFHERLKSIEEGLTQGLQDIARLPAKQLESPKLRQLEEGQKALLSDLKQLKEGLASCHARQNDLEKSVQGQMKDVQQNLQKALQLLGGPEKTTEVYTVKTGDSLGLIAQHHKVSLKALQESNNLKGDQIYVGQKLKLP
jgi:LysM repeat protein